MAATTSQGTGHGASNKETTQELSILANGPQIIFAGRVEGITPNTSPASETGVNTITFPYVLAGGSDKYVVLLTTVNGGNVYVSDVDEDGDGNFSGFSFIAEAECTVMYLVTKVGTKPNI